MPGNKSWTTRKVKKCSAGQKNSLAAATNAHKENQFIKLNLVSAEETSLDSQGLSDGVSIAKATLAKAQKAIVAKDLELTVEHSKHSHTCGVLRSVKNELHATQNDLYAKDKACAHAMQQAFNHHRALRNERRKVHHAQHSKGLLEDHIQLLESVHLPSAQKDVALVQKLLDQTSVQNANLKNQLSALIDNATAEATKLKEKLAESQKKVRTLKRRVNHHPKALQKAIAKANKLARKHTMVYKLTHKGVYTSKARALARTLVNAGCSQQYVGKVIENVCRTAGIAVHGKMMSRRTVSRAIREGGIAAQIQIGHEMAQANGKIAQKSSVIKSNAWCSTGITASGDGTTHRHEPIEARHLSYKVAESASNSECPKKHVTHFIGINCPLEQTAECNAQDWQDILADTSDLYNSSPLAK
jgi:hypothetical protein